MSIQNAFGLTMLDVTYLFGNYGSRFYELIAPKNLGSPIRPPSRCLLVRMITDWDAAGKGFPARPEMYTDWPLLMPCPPSGDDFNNLIKGFRTVIRSQWPNFTDANVGVLLGLSGNRATERWSEGESTPHPGVQRLMTYLAADLRQRGEAALEDHMQRVETEAMARRHLGIDDLLQSSRWNSVKNIDSRRGTGAQRNGRAA